MVETSATRRWVIAFLGLASGVLASGCYKASFVEDPSSAEVDAPPTVEVRTDHYLFGLIGHEEVDTRDHCPEGTSAVRTGGDASTGALTVVTLGVYAPRKVFITCKAPEKVAGRDANDAWRMR